MRVVFAALAALTCLACASAQTVVFGESVPGLAAYDAAVTGVMAKYGIPSGALAVSRDGKLVFAHGYNVPPDALFRIMSLSKPITATAVLGLAEKGLVDLDSAAFRYLPDLQPIAGAQTDPRLAKITVRDLLRHSAGWDEENSPDPFDQTVSIAKSLGKTSPASSEDVIRYAMGKPLAYDPGTKFLYSNLGYCVLGRIVERVTGVNYERYVRTKLLAPLGIERMRIGNTLAPGRVSGEVTYSSPGTAPTVFPFGPAQTPLPYGSWYLEGLDSAAGWIGSAVDVLKFWNAINGRRGGPLLSAASRARIETAPSYAVPGSGYYGLGFNVVPAPGGAYWWHDGQLDGSRTLAVRNAAGFNWVVLFDKGDDGIGPDIDAALWNALGQVAAWPSGDRFSAFDTPNVSRPAIQTQDGVLNAASFQRGFTAGSWASLFGVNLSGSTRIWNSSDFAGSSLPTSLDGVSVKVGGAPAAVYYVSPGQINFQVPGGLALGAVTVEVTRDGVSSGPAMGELRAAAPALFTFGAGNVTYAAAVFPDGGAVGPGRAAKPGDRISLYGSNFEASSPGSFFTSPKATAGVPAVRVGGLSAAVEYAGLTGVGLYQINIVVPAAPDGDQSVLVTYAGVTTQGNVSLAVHR